jgi:alpha-beta hydrolase superfamily lysophospholipase
MVALRVARNVVAPPARRRYDIEVLAVDLVAGTVTLSRTDDTVVPGRYSLWFDGDRGHARMGEILEQTHESVTRRVDSVQRGDLGLATKARWAGWWYLTPDDLGVVSRDVDIATPLGVAPAWIIDGGTSSDDWVIQVHGRGVTRAEGLRAVSVFAAAGFTSLLISYRNDGDAPPSNDRRYALGGEEWRDVEAAIRYARDNGAQRVVLMGWSMGGAIVLQCVTRSALADVVVGVVLESPVVDWVRVLHYQAGLTHLPAPVREAAMAILSSDVGSGWAGLDQPIDFAQLDMVERAHELRVPILILHSIDDGFVPSNGSVALAHRRGDIVRFERFATARHTKLWNYDAPRWERAIGAWLAEVINPARQTAG